MASFLGLVTGGVAFGVSFGVEYIPVAPLWRTVIFGTGGLLGSVGLAKWGSPTLGAGFGGGIGALLAGRIVTQVRMAQVAPQSTSASQPGASGAPRRMNAVYNRGAASVHQYRGAGAVYARDAGAATTMRRPVFGPSFKDAGASRYIPGPVRYFGPKSWAYEGGAVYVSAHNVPK